MYCIGKIIPSYPMGIRHGIEKMLTSHCSHHVRIFVDAVFWVGTPGTPIPIPPNKNSTNTRTVGFAKGHDECLEKTNPNIFSQMVGLDG